MDRGALLTFDSDISTANVRTSERSPWLVVAAAVSTTVVVALTVWWSLNRAVLDFSVYMMGARHLTDAHLYLISLPVAPYLPFTYPPFAALAFWPFTALSFRVAAVTWALINVVALAAVIALSIRAVRPNLDRHSRLLWSLALLGPAVAIEPVSLTFSFGQVNLILAAAVMADLTGHFHFRGHTLPRGVLIGIAAAVKLIPLIFVPYLFFTHRRREAGVSLVTFVFCSLVTFAINPTASWQFWTKYGFDAKRVGGVSYISNQSLRGALDRLTHSVLSTGVSSALAALGVVAGIAVACWAWRSGSAFLGILVCATTGLLASPITWAHHMVWVIAVVIWLVWANDRPVGGRVWAAMAALLFCAAPIWWVPADGGPALHEHGWQLLAGNSFFFANTLFMVGVAIMLWSRQRRDANDGAEVSVQ